MTDAYRQQTLLSSGSGLAEGADQLTLTQVSAWYALELSTVEPSKLTPLRKLTDDLFESLEHAGVLKRATIQTPEARTALYDSLSWTYATHELSTSADSNQLAAVLRMRACDSELDEIAAIWKLLASAESESYLQSQLARHRLDFNNLEEILALAQRLWDKHPLGRRRYLAWHAVRHSAASMMRSSSNLSFAADILLSSIERRSRWLLQKANAKAQANDYCFVPEAGWRSPILVKVFQTEITGIGSRYYSSLPAAENV